MVIGFAGKAASGKSTAAQMLRQRLGDQLVILPMAQVLRKELEDFIQQVGAEQFVPLIYGDQDDKLRLFYVDSQRAAQLCPQWDDYRCMNGDIQDRSAETAVTVRRLLQWWGTEYRRAQDPDYWTKAWAVALQQYDLERLHVLVDDVRFINELKEIRANGGQIFRIVRPGFDGANNHSSENSLDGYNHWDMVIENNGSLEDLAARLEESVLPLLTV